MTFNSCQWMPPNVGLCVELLLAALSVELPSWMYPLWNYLKFSLLKLFFMMFVDFKEFKRVSSCGFRTTQYFRGPALTARLLVGRCETLKTGLMMGPDNSCLVMVSPSYQWAAPSLQCQHWCPLWIKHGCNTQQRTWLIYKLTVIQFYTTSLKRHQVSVFKSLYQLFCLKIPKFQK